MKPTKFSWEKSRFHQINSFLKIKLKISSDFNNFLWTMFRSSQGKWQPVFTILANWFISSTSSVYQLSNLPILASWRVTCFYLQPVNLILTIQTSLRCIFVVSFLYQTRLAMIKYVICLFICPYLSLTFRSIYKLMDCNLVWTDLCICNLLLQIPLIWSELSYHLI